MEYLLHNFLVHIPLSSRNLPVDAHARGSMASAGMELHLGKLCQNGDHQRCSLLHSRSPGVAPQFSRRGKHLPEIPNERYRLIMATVR
jgi:hypothetical protein